MARRVATPCGSTRQPAMIASRVPRMPSPSTHAHAVRLHARVTPERDGTADARSARQHAVARRPSSVARHPSRAKSGMIGA
ncbi:conserved hypothetical protein [Burkholderia pseudomallei Pasteur 52237]|nr:conserved hypothetical protein [Burkholderia pseudomallei Pasteur 52237]EEC38206.1 conserved hypothetical protein [Burkholderia pseudomallei 576]